MLGTWGMAALLPIFPAGRDEAGPRGAAAAQLDHCRIHHNLRDGLGYGVAVYSGAGVLIVDNEFGQNRHSLASNGPWTGGAPNAPASTYTSRG